MLASLIAHFVCVHSSIIVGIFAIRFDSFDSSFRIDFRSLHLFHFQYTHTHTHTYSRSFSNFAHFFVCIVSALFIFSSLLLCAFCAHSKNFYFNEYTIMGFLAGIIILFAIKQRHHHPIIRFDSFFLRSFIRSDIFFSRSLHFFCSFGVPSFFTDTFDLRND